jgi:hypothetical protein
MTAKTAGEIIDLLLYRTRSVGGTAFTPALSLQILSLAQSFTQASMRRLIKSATLTLYPQKPLYDTDAEFTDCIQVVGIEDESKALAQAAHWKELSYINSNWLGVAAQNPKLFSRIGLHYLAITPTPAHNRNVTATYVYDPPTLETVSTEMALPDEDLTFCLDLAEAVILLSTARGNKLTEATAKIKQFIQRASQISIRVKNERDI